MAKIELIDKVSNSAMTRPVIQALKDSINLTKENGCSRVLVIMVNDLGCIHYECAQMNDIQRIAYLEMTKNLMIRDLYNGKAPQ